MVQTKYRWSFLWESGKAKGGGIISDSDWNWVKGFSRLIGHATGIMAEFWALKDGLKLALSIGI